MFGTYTGMMRQGEFKVTTGQQLGVDVVNTFTLTLLFNPIADMSEIRTGFGPIQK